jgi:zinc protease
MKRATFARALAVILAVACGLPLVAQQPSAPPPLTQKLGVGPEFVVGTLPNGLKYYIRKNVEPAKRMELRLVVNAGSTLEDNDQLGYAHFIEHMAFNGTTHFKKNDLVKYLQSIGVRFGNDLNAYTNYNETVYQLTVPTDTARLVEQGFLVLEDWAHGQLFDSAEVVKERGVVVEEWRGRLGAGERMQRVFIPIILKGSRYAIRDVIGTEESILKAQPSVLRRYYNDWYRPDLMAVVAVGDFDVTQIEGLIKKHFSGIRQVPKARSRTVADVPNNATPLIAITSDVEATSSAVTIGYKRPNKIISTVGDYRAEIAEGLHSAMLNARFTEIAQKPDAPFLGASAGNSSFFARGVQAFTVGAGVKDGGIERGAEAVLAEIRRVEQFGFLASELQRAKDNALRSNERMYAERAKTNSAAQVGELVRNFLEQEDIPGVEAEYILTKQLMPGITLAEVNALTREWVSDSNRVALVVSPRKAGLALPTEAQILAVFDRASKATVTAYTETVSDAALLDHLPAPGRVIATRTIDAVGVTEWKLSNGARVLVKPTDFKADEVLFSAYSPGGTSLVSDADYMSASNASMIIGRSGVGSFSAVDLNKKLAGKAANASAMIGATSENLSGSASPKDLETLFQLAHLRFMAPRLDTAAWLAMKAQIDASLANRGVNPMAAFVDTLSVVLSQHHFRSRPPSAATISEINPQRALEIYKDRFANAGDFTFVFVGNVKLDSLKPLVEKYLASLPGTGRVETWKDVGDAPPSGIVEKVVHKGSAPQAQTALIFTGPFAYNPQSRFDMLALTTLAQMWLTDALREEMGGTYSPNLGGAGGKVPRSEYAIQVQFTSSPDNVDKLTARTFRVIDSLKTVGPTDADITKVREQILRGRETNLKTNMFWVSNIASRDVNGEDIAGLLAPYDSMVKQLTAKEIQDAAKRYFDLTRYVKVVLLPESKQP